MGVSRSDECAERVMAIVRPRYLVKLAVAGAVPILTNFKNSYKLIETCYAAGTCTVALSTSYSINLGWRLIKSSRTQRYQNAKAIQEMLYSLCILVSLGT